jgi:hypothetical protein
MLTLLLAVTIAAVPADLAQYEKVLLPVVITPVNERITGVGGSQFDTDVDAVTLMPVRVWTGGDVETVERIGRLTFPGVSRAGRVLHVERAHADALSLNATLRSSATGERWHAATLPVVRERDLHTTTARILGVSSPYSYDPPDGVARRAIAHYRHHLRVYDVDGRGDAQVRVRRFVVQTGGTPIADEILTLDRREGADASHPAFAEVVIPELCVPFSLHTPCAGATQWIEVEPLTPGLRFFPLVSATDNVTQQVTVSWPQ